MAESMKRKGFRLASLTYFLSLGALSVSLLAYFSLNGTFAWFGLNKRVDATGMAIAVKKEKNVNIDLTSYKKVPSSDGINYVLDSQSTPHALNRYDQVFTADNVYTPVLLKLVLTDGAYGDGEELPLKVHHNPEKDSEIIRVAEDGTSSTESTSETSLLSSYISSVLNIRAAVYNGPFDFDAIVSFFKGTGTLNGESYSSGDHSFVSYSTDSGKTTIEASGTDPVHAKKEEAISIPGVKYYNAGSSTSRRCTLYIYLDYNESLINAYIDQMKGGSGVMLMETNYALGADLDYISIRRDD